jgi:hypothetical protein
MVNSDRDALLDEMNRELTCWKRRTTQYGTAYYLSRIILIVASAVVAAGTRLASISSWVPTLALLVTILTSLDAWLKPRERWRGFMESRDELADLLIRASEEMEDRPRLREEFRTLRRAHREKNLL